MGNILLQFDDSVLYLVSMWKLMGQTFVGVQVSYKFHFFDIGQSKKSTYVNHHENVSTIKFRDSYLAQLRKKMLTGILVPIQVSNGLAMNESLWKRQTRQET